MNSIRFEYTIKIKVNHTIKESFKIVARNLQVMMWSKVILSGS